MGRKRKAEEEHENSERWLLTYSDMITLLMAFFIMMYAMSVLNLTKFQQVAFAIRSGFGGVIENAGDSLLSSPAGRKTVRVTDGSYQTDSMMQSLGKLNDFIITKSMQKQVQVSEEPRGVVITLTADGLLFPSGSAELNEKAFPVLDKVAKVLRGTPKQYILVEGHTDVTPINTTAYPTNWELSAARASRVVRYFQDANIKGNHLAAVGYGSTRPKVKNNTPENRALNRRVDVVILKGNMDSLSSGSLVEKPTLKKTSNHLKPNLHDVIDMGETERENQ